MRYWRWLIPGCAALFLAGCFQVSTVVRVNPDGSGTVEERMLLSKKLLAQLDEMMKGFAGDSGTKPEPIEIFEPAKLKAQAETMGEGVTYRAGEKIETSDYRGYLATYDFTDINRLRINQKSGDAAGSPAGTGKPPSLPIIFHFSKGFPATLTVEQPREASSETTAAVPMKEVEASPPSQGAVSDEEAKKFAEQFMGMKFSLVIEVNGTIVKTNATHRDGKRLTLVEFDLEKLGHAAPQLEKLAMLQNSSLEDARNLLKDFPGMKVDMNDKLSVTFNK